MFDSIPWERARSVVPVWGKEGRPIAATAQAYIEGDSSRRGNREAGAGTDIATAIAALPTRPRLQRRIVPRLILDLHELCCVHRIL